MEYSFRLANERALDSLCVIRNTKDLFVSYVSKILKTAIFYNEDGTSYNKTNLVEREKTYYEK
ncbi:hypothetical protein MKY37_18000 [Psychrobacillus sp. FSL K6-2836]|uniref:hypothetical protein n=1 Tax=Psychrobacillus sp. FSL K6-2836 TaxID=2921548 RepID=UPI0030F6E446